MRIISGEKGSRIILSPPGKNTRPTGDHVREALFNILGELVVGASVLDLFAGSGALALEALSRGAKMAVMVDNDADAVRTLTRNIASLGYSDTAYALFGHWDQNLKRLSKQRQSFDLIFIDPPYQRIRLDEIGTRLVQNRLVKQGATVVIEHDTKTSPFFGEAYEPIDMRRYGRTHLSFYHFREGVDCLGANK